MWIGSCGTNREAPSVMTRNRTAMDLFSTVGTELMVVLLLVLAMGLAVSQYFALAHVRMRRVEAKLRRRAARRVEA